MKLDNFCDRSARAARRRNHHAVIALALSRRPAGMMSLQELHTTTDFNKLPIEDVDDQSLVYSKTRLARHPAGDCTDAE